MCAENYSEGILLSGLPLYLVEPGRAFNWTPLASVLSRWGDQLGPGERQLTEAENPVRDAENAQRSTRNGVLLSWTLDVGRWTFRRFPVLP